MFSRNPAPEPSAVAGVGAGRLVQGGHEHPATAGQARSAQPRAALSLAPPALPLQLLLAAALPVG